MLSNLLSSEVITFCANDCTEKRMVVIKNSFFITVSLFISVLFLNCFLWGHYVTNGSMQLVAAEDIRYNINYFNRAPENKYESTELKIFDLYIHLLLAINASQ